MHAHVQGWIRLRVRNVGQNLKSLGFRVLVKDFLFATGRFPGDPNDLQWLAPRSVAPSPTDLKITG